MSKKHAKIDKLQKTIEQPNEPAVDPGVLLLPISNNEFQARWSLTQETLDSGFRAASHLSGEARLVLRVYSLPTDSKHSDFSNFWKDYSIDGRENNACFSFTAPAVKITAAVGVINKSGRFSPLARAQAITLLLPPAPPTNLPKRPPIPASGGKLPPQSRQRHKNG